MRCTLLLLLLPSSRAQKFKLDKTRLEAFMMCAHSLVVPTEVQTCTQRDKVRQQKQSFLSKKKTIQILYIASRIYYFIYLHNPYYIKEKKNIREINSLLMYKRARTIRPPADAGKFSLKNFSIYYACAITTTLPHTSLLLCCCLLLSIEHAHSCCF